MRRLLLALSLTALLCAMVTASALAAKASGVSATRVNFGKIQPFQVYTADLTITNNTGEDITGTAPVLGSSVFSFPNWTCGTITSADKTCTTQVQVYVDLLLAHGANRITQSVTFSYVGATTSNTYTATTTFAATQTAG